MAVEIPCPTCPTWSHFIQDKLKISIYLSLDKYKCSDSFTILGLWVLGLAVSNINESQLQIYESKTLFLMTSLQYYCIPGLAGTR